MTKIKDMLKSDETLFKNREVFDPEHIPEEFLYRDAQLQELASYIKPGIKGERPTNTFIFGPPSTGKTTAVKKIFKEVRKESNKIALIHVNCQLNSSIYKIFSKIHRQVIGHEPPETGVPLSKVMDKIFKNLKKKEKSLLIALDDINFLPKSTMNDVMYKILRAHEQYPKIKTATWLISTEKILHLLEERVRSIFTPREVTFNKYSFKEMVQIMQKRTKNGLYANVLSKKLLEKIIENSKDLREAIELTKQSILTAENEASKKIKEKHIDKVMDNFNPKDIDSIEEKILDLIREKDITTGDLFKKLNIEKSYSSFYRLLKKMNKKDLIEFESVKKGKGKSRLVKKA